VVHYRSANQQTAHYAKKSYEIQKQQARHASASNALDIFKLFGGQAVGGSAGR